MAFSPHTFSIPHSLVSLARCICEASHFPLPPFPPPFAPSALPLCSISLTHTHTHIAATHLRPLCSAGSRTAISTIFTPFSHSSPLTPLHREPRHSHVRLSEACPLILSSLTLCMCAFCCSMPQIPSPFAPPALPLCSACARVALPPVSFVHACALRLLFSAVGASACRSSSFSCSLSVWPAVAALLLLATLSSFSSFHPTYAPAHHSTVVPTVWSR